MAASIDVVLPRNSNDLGWVEELVFPDDDTTSMCIDASAVVMHGPMLPARLAAVLHACRLQGVTVEFVPPQVPAIGCYLAATGLTEAAPDELDLRLGPAEDGSDVLVPVLRLADQAAADALDHTFAAAYRQRFDGEFGVFAEPFHQAAGELLDNATTHGNSDCGAFVAAQRFPGNRCVLVIGDAGIGIPAHLGAVHSVADDEEALREAMKEGITATGDEHRGMGYYWVRDAIKQAAVERADVSIWSGEARADLKFRYGDLVYEETEVAPPTRGTWLLVQMRRS